MSPTNSPSVTPSNTASPSPTVTPTISVSAAAAGMSDFTEQFRFAPVGSNFGSAVIYSGVSLGESSFSGIGGWTRKGVQATGFEIFTAGNDLSDVDAYEDSWSAAFSFPGNSSFNAIPDSFAEDTLENGLGFFYAISSADLSTPVLKSPYSASNPPAVHVQVGPDSTFGITPVSLTNNSVLTFTVKWLF